MCVSCNLSCMKEQANWCRCSRDRRVCVSETTSLHLDNYVGPEVENGVTLCFVCVEGLHWLLHVELTNFLCLWQGKDTQSNPINFIWLNSQVEAHKVRSVGPLSWNLCSTSPLAVGEVLQKCNGSVYTLLQRDAMCSGMRVSEDKANGQKCGFPGSGSSPDLSELLQVVSTL